MVDFYIPQLIVLYMNIPEVAEVIHPYMVKRCKDSVEFSLECCWLLDAYGANVFRKFSHGYRLRQSILNEFRDRSYDLKASAVMLSPSAQQCFQAASGTTVHRTTDKTEQIIPKLRNNAEFLSNKNIDGKEIFGDLTSGGAFGNGCSCFDDERYLCDKENMKAECKCGALKIQPEQEFVKALMNIGNKLKVFSNKDERTRCLVDELCKINVNLPARVWLPLYTHSLKHIILRIPPLAGCILNSKDKVPYCLFVEVLEVTDIRQTKVPKRISDIEAAEYHRKGCDIFASLTKNTMTEFKKIVKCLTRMQRKGNTAEIRKRFSLWVKGPKRQLRDTPDDPSASAMSEPWEDKVARIRHSSPYGRHPLWRLLPVIVKTGDDLRQELLAYQLLSVLRNIWVEEKVPLYLRPYKIVVCSPNSGMIEPILGASSLHQIKKNMVIRSPTFDAVQPALLTHFSKHLVLQVLKHFLLRSKILYGVVPGTVLLVIFTSQRQVGGTFDTYRFWLYTFHITKNLGFETSPFKLTRELVDVMGGVDSDMFGYYKILILKGLLATRKHYEQIVSIVEIMITGSQLPCFRGGSSTVRLLKNRFHMNYTEEQLRTYFCPIYPVTAQVAHAFMPLIFKDKDQGHGGSWASDEYLILFQLQLISNMGLDKRRILETSLFDLEQIVTVQYLSRHGDLSIDEAKSIFFNKNRTELHAIYVLSGELKIPDVVSSTNIGEASVTRKHRTQLVRDHDLEETRTAYRKVKTCEIYCLHAKPIKNLCWLYSVDSLEDAEFERTDPKRSWLSYPETEAKTKEMLAHYGAISIPGTQKPSMDSVSQKGQGNVVRKSDVMLGKAIKCRRQRVLIDGKEKGVREETESLEITGVKNVGTKLLEVTTSKNNDVLIETRNTLLTQDDLFSDGNSNSDKLGCDEIRTTKTVKKEEIGKITSILNDSLENESNYGNQKRETRKEYVTETFLDNDGFMVTKQVLKEIEVETSSAHASTEMCDKTTIKPLDNRERRNKIPQRQAKINSFFQRK
ncbi:Phosphatidylinositol 4-kinase beta [Dirofilaria immitis]|nr:Phosphatidylinositol 4-kinase beta [Dirofilaria immitis]